MATKKPADTADPDVALVRALAEILGDTGLSEVELERKGTRVRVSRNVTYAAAAPVAVTSQPIAVAAPAAEVAPKDLAGVVKSPMVGTVYRAAAPGSPNFIEVGTEVRQGQTLIIIEAMKTMNQIPAPRAGKVTQILVSERQPVEFGEPICVIE